MKEKEKERDEKPYQAVAEGRPSGSGGGSRLGTVRASGGRRFCV